MDWYVAKFLPVPNTIHNSYTHNLVGAATDNTTTTVSAVSSKPLLTTSAKCTCVSFFMELNNWHLVEEHL